jgi:hypothetical protein
VIDKILYILISFCLIQSGSLLAQENKRQVTAERMKEIYDEIKTPFKYGLVIVPKLILKK